MKYTVNVIYKGHEWALCEDDNGAFLCDARAVEAKGPGEFDSMFSQERLSFAAARGIKSLLRI